MNQTNKISIHHYKTQSNEQKNYSQAHLKELILKNKTLSIGFKTKYHKQLNSLPLLSLENSQKKKSEQFFNNNSQSLGFYTTNKYPSTKTDSENFYNFWASRDKIHETKNQISSLNINENLDYRPKDSYSSNQQNQKDRSLFNTSQIKNITLVNQSHTNDYDSNSLFKEQLNKIKSWKNLLEVSGQIKQDYNKTLFKQQIDHLINQNKQKTLPNQYLPDFRSLPFFIKQNQIKQKRNNEIVSEIKTLEIQLEDFLLHQTNSYQIADPLDFFTRFCTFLDNQYQKEYSISSFIQKIKLIFELLFSALIDDAFKRNQFKEEQSLEILENNISLKDKNKLLEEQNLKLLKYQKDLIEQIQSNKKQIIMINNNELAELMKNEELQTQIFKEIKMLKKLKDNDEKLWKLMITIRQKGINLQQILQIENEGNGGSFLNRLEQMVINEKEQSSNANYTEKENEESPQSESECSSDNNK